MPTLKHSIIHVIDSLGVGGAERLLCTTILALPGYKHIVCYLNAPHSLAESTGADKIYFLDFKTNKDLITCAIRLRNIIKREQPFLVHSHLLRSTWISRLATFKKVPLVFTVHNSLSEDAFKVNRLSLLMEKLTYTKSQTLISVSQSALQDYKEWVGLKGKTYVVYNVINEAFFNAYHPLPSRTGITRLVAVGSLRRQKNYTNLVRSFMHLKDVDVTLDIYGTGEEQNELELLIKKHHLPVTLKGVTNDIPVILRDYDAFIMSSLFEGYGIAPVEAMAAGLPLILSNLEVFKEITGGGATFFDPLQTKSIADAVRKFVQMPFENKKALSEAGRLKASQIASKESFVSAITNIYNIIKCN